MAGLISQGMEPEDDIEERDEVAEEGGSDEDVDRFVLAAKKVVFGEGGMAEEIGQRLISAQDPAQEMADIAYEIVAGVDERTGAMLPDESVAEAAAEVLGMVAEIAQAAGIEVGSRDLARATKAMVSRYMRENGASEEEMAQVAGADDAAVGQEIESMMGAA